MKRTMIEDFTSTPEGMAHFQQERLILEITELICEVMEQEGVTKSELAVRLGRSKTYVGRLLGGNAGMTIRGISDVMSALGRSLHVLVWPIAIDGSARDAIKMFADIARAKGSERP